MKKLLVGVAAALTLSAGAFSAAGAHAATYLNLIGGCACGLPSYGTVKVTGEGTTQLDFDVELASGVYFNQAGNSVDETFSLAGAPVINITSISDTAHFGTVANNLAAGNFVEPSSLGKYMYHLTWLGNPNNNGNIPGSGIQSLKFTVTSTSNLFLASGVVANGAHAGDPTGFFFTADITRGPHGPTGQVGGVPFTPSVPEPATWAMMLMGFGGLGAVLRRRRAVLA